MVCMRSPVSMLALSSTGMPCKGPSTLPCRRNCVGMPRPRERVGIDLDHRIHARPVLIERENAADVFARQRFGGQTPRGHFGLQLRDGEVLVAGRRIVFGSAAARGRRKRNTTVRA